MIGRRETPSTQKSEKPRGFDDYDLRLGDLMRGERATIGKSLLDVQRELKIKATYIAAIENCDVAAFETPGFIAGYVRSYARYLGMDPEWAYQRFCEEADFSVVHGMAAEALRRTPAPERKAPPRAQEPRDPLAAGTFIPKVDPWYGRIEPGAVGSLAVLLVLIGAIGYGGWSVFQEVQRVQLAPVDEAPGVLADLDPIGGAVLDGLPEAPSSGVAMGGGDALNRLYRPPALDAPVMVARDGPISAIDPRRSEGAFARRSAGNQIDDEAERIAAEVAARASGEGDTVQVVEAGPPQVELLAVRPSWVRVRAADGTVLFEQILDAGERYEVAQTEEPARLRAGNSGSVYFVVNGETFGPAAPGANIADNIALSAEALRDGFALADLGRDPDLARMVDVAEAGGGN
ncbi:helix-turn-helix domain-containing protein [Alkalilacustris brevis]|uniref:helix-turn-helix domain-containing protein n=1 Tax=Alkalilacustris brevis TaxID=2026338 RepID=UPI000E0D7B7D|nr:helix-turn-helix domain-containing protein [Alkalilacustris brevis]